MALASMWKSSLFFMGFGSLFHLVWGVEGAARNSKPLSLKS